MADAKIPATKRTEFGKGASRRLRRDGRVPGVVYGHGMDPLHVALPAHDTTMAIKHGGANALLVLDVDGDEQLALTKQIQSDPIKGHLKHVDFVAVRKGEKVTVDVPIVVVGEAVSDTLVVTDANVVSIEAEATNIPESIEVSVQGMEAGEQILASDLEIPAGSTLLEEPDLLIVNITVPRMEEEPEPEAAEGEGVEGEAAEGGEEAAAEGDGEGDSEE